MIGDNSGQICNSGPNWFPKIVRVTNKQYNLWHVTPILIFLRIFFSNAIVTTVAIVVYKMTQTNPLQYRPTCYTNFLIRNDDL